MSKNNDKRDKFVKLAEGRTQAALTAIRKIGNLSNERAYDYDDADVRKIIKALKESVSEAEKRFTSNGSQSDQFKL